MPTLQTPPTEKARPAELHSGDRMAREEFHRIYQQMPPGFKAELIGGTVFVASLVSLHHGVNHLPLGSLLVAYQADTPGVQCGDNTTIFLADDSEPQPDLFLRVLPECGGRSRTTQEGYIQGPPELVVEIAHSSRALDLNAKRQDYRENGILEYLVLLPVENEIRWFDLAADRELKPDAQGICRINVFPGLWIDAPSLLRQNYHGAMATLRKGLGSPEHAEFANRLAAAKK